MEITHRHEFAASVPQVMAMFASEEFAQRRARAAGATDAEVVVDGDANGDFTVSIRRIVPSSSIPAEFRSFVGSDLTVRYVEAWQAPDGDDRVGTFVVEIVGAPGHARGALGVAPAGDGTEFIATGEVSVNVPLIGGMIERGVAEAVRDGLTKELLAADAWLAAH